MAGRRWTAAETAALERLLEEGMRPPEIAAELGRTVDAVRDKIYGRGLSLVNRRPMGRPRAGAVPPAGASDP